MKHENCGPAEAVDSEPGLVVQITIDNPRSCFVKDQVDGNTVRMLLICPNEEQKLFTFDIPRDDCTVQDLLDEAKIPMCEGLNIFLVKDLKMEINYIVKFIWETCSLSEEDRKRRDANADKSITREDNSSGFFSSLEETNGNSSITENETLEKGKKDKNQLLKLEQEGSGPSEARRKQNRGTAEPKLFKNLDCVVDMSSDEEDQRKGNPEKSKLENNHSMMTNPNNPRDEIEIEMIFEKASVTTNSNSVSSISEFNVDYKEGINGGKMLRDTQNVEFDNSIQAPYTSLICGIVMIGSYNYTPQDRVIISQSGVRLSAPFLKDDTNFVVLELKFEDILKAVIQFEEAIPVIFLYIKMSAVATIRKFLGMEKSQGPYYDPFSTDNTQKRLALLLDEITEESELVLRTLFSPNKVLIELTSKEAADLLWSAAPENIRPQIVSWITKSKYPPTSAVNCTVNDNIKTLVKKAHNQSSMQISERATSTLKDPVDKEIEPVFKHSKNPMKRSRESTSTVRNSVQGEVQTLLVYPRLPARGGITITAEDYACLSESHFLNDVIIDFYLKYLTLEVLSEEDRDRTHIFSIHFYKRLTSQHSLATNSNVQMSPATERHSNVRKWTKNINIFEKNFIVIPINQNAHWFLAIICFPGLVGKAEVNTTAAEACEIEKTSYKRKMAKEMKLELFAKQDHKKISKLPCILIFDSLAGPTSKAQSVIRMLRDYLTCEHLAVLGTERIFSEENMKGASPKVPQQTNFSDCGLYVLQYVESFFSDPITDYTLPIETLEHWFDEIIVTRKRKELSKLIRKLMGC